MIFPHRERRQGGAGRAVQPAGDGHNNTSPMEDVEYLRSHTLCDASRFFPRVEREYVPAEWHM